MKKSLFTLAALATIMASCTSDDLLIDEKVQNTPETAIGFSTFANKATRAENSGKDYTEGLNSHHTNFAVWGYKNTEADKVFNNQLVSWNTGVTPNAWTYTPVRFWDKAATTYEFYAAAPQTDENGTTVAWTFNGDDTVDDNAHYFSLTGVTLVGSNLSNTTTPTTTYAQSFIAAPKVGGKQDIDYMIADKKSVGKTAFTSDAIELDFIHILSRLNVTIQKKSTMPAAAVVTLKSLEVVNLKSKGDFDESKVAADGTKRIGRWTNLSTAYTISAITDYVVTTDAKYVLQSLVIPQEAEIQNVALDGTATGAAVAISTLSKPYIKIVYTIDPDGNGDVPAEKYTAYYNLATVFGMGTVYNTVTNPDLTDPSIYYVEDTENPGSYIVADGNEPDGTQYYEEVEQKLAFNEGWQNLLNITIDPVQINFTGKVAPWDDDLSKDLTVN